jgi:hypothetical protein
MSGFIRNAANFTPLLTKGSKFRYGNKNLDFGLNCPFQGSKCVFKEIAALIKA